MGWGWQEALRQRREAQLAPDLDIPRRNKGRCEIWTSRDFLLEKNSCWAPPRSSGFMPGQIPLCVPEALPPNGQQWGRLEDGGSWVAQDQEG